MMALSVFVTKHFSNQDELIMRVQTVVQLVLGQAQQLLRPVINGVELVSFALRGLKIGSSEKIVAEEIEVNAVSIAVDAINPELFLKRRKGQN
jgi:hypothetical protein